MKSSACCTTRSKTVRIFFAVLVLVLSAHARAQIGAPQELIQQWNEIADKNDLIVKGKLPFHLKVDFQLHDLQGHPTSKGTLEEWWADDKGFRLEITSPVEHVVGPGPKHLESDDARRENYLVMQLLHDLVAPMAHLKPEMPYNIFREKRTTNGLPLTCYQYGSASATAPNPHGSFICVNAETGSIRQVPYADEVAARNNMGLFRGQIVALDSVISYDDVKAIEGHISLLQSFDPAQAGVALVNPEAKRALPPTTVASAASETAGGDSPAPEKSADKAAAVAGSAASVDPQEVPSVYLYPENAEQRLLKAVQSVYPDAARRARLAGMVLLYVTISPEGVVESSFPIVSANQVLTQAAQDCVKRWTYKPYELNGKPTKVNTTVSFHFRLNSSIYGLR